MIRTYIKTAVRSLLRDRTYALINGIGLVAALSVLLLTLAYIRHELSFDRHLPNANDIYRLVTENVDVGSMRAVSAEPLGETLVDLFPEALASTTFWGTSHDGMYLGDGGTSHPLMRTNVQADFFDVFDFKRIAGAITPPLNAQAAVITERAARALFPNSNAVGKQFYQQRDQSKKYPLTVVAVIENIPEHTHFHADVLIGQLPRSRKALTLEAYSPSSQYIRLRSGTNQVDFEKKMNESLRARYGLKDPHQIRLLPVKDIYLKSKHVEEIRSKQHDIRLVYLFGLIAFLILMIACINYVNLSTARHLQKAKEMGVRKVLGASRTQLGLQVFTDSLLLFSLALLPSIGVAWLAWPLFAELLEISNTEAYLFDLVNLGVLVVVAVLSAFLASLYPTWIVIREPAAQLFKRKLQEVQLAFGPRKTLMAFQFTITIALIVATLVVYNQLHMLRNRSMGFEKDHLLVVNNQRQTGSLLKEQLLQIPTVLAVSIASGTEIGKGGGSNSSMTDPNNPHHSWKFSMVTADFDFIETMQIELLDGRNFDASYGSDLTPRDSFSNWDFLMSRAMIITKTTAERLGIHSTDTLIRLNALQGRVVGIVEDFRLTSLKEEGPMMVLKPGHDETRGNLYIRIANHDVPSTMAAIEKTWQHVNPNEPLDRYFVDEKIQQLYVKEDNLASLFSMFSVLAIVISAMGLFSLTSLMVKQRTKEIGIRKVLGATSWEINRLLIQEFMAIILVSVLIALPVSWWIMNKWLEEYAHRIEISGWTLFFGAGFAFVLTFLTVSWQTQRAARANPVYSLREE